MIVMSSGLQYKDTMPRYPHCRGLKSVKENGRIMSGNVEIQE